MLRIIHVDNAKTRQLFAYNSQCCTLPRNYFFAHTSSKQLHLHPGDICSGIAALPYSLEQDPFDHPNATITYRLAKTPRKMPMQDFVDVRMSLDGQRAYEHQCPGEPEQDGALTRYIEVASGQCWSIDVRVLKNFSFRSAPHLCVEMKTDDQRSLWYHHRPRRDFPRQRGYLKDDFAIGRFGRVRAWDDQRGVWAYHKYQIGALGTSQSPVHALLNRILTEMQLKAKHSLPQRLERTSIS